jgi:hypothetical protein
MLIGHTRHAQSIPSLSAESAGVAYQQGAYYTRRLEESKKIPGRFAEIYFFGKFDEWA